MTIYVHSSQPLLSTLVTYGIGIVTVRLVIAYHSSLASMPTARVAAANYNIVAFLMLSNSCKTPFPRAGIASLIVPFRASYFVFPDILEDSESVLDLKELTGYGRLDNICFDVLPSTSQCSIYKKHAPHGITVVLQEHLG